MTELELLKAARNLISRPSNWCQRSSAKDSNDQEVSVTSPTASRFCALGAITKVGLDSSSSPWELIDTPMYRLNAKARAMYDRMIVNVNDELTHDDVLKVFDAVIEELEQDDTKKAGAEVYNFFI